MESLLVSDDLDGDVFASPVVQGAYDLAEGPSADHFEDLVPVRDVVVQDLVVGAVVVVVAAILGRPFLAVDLGRLVAEVPHLGVGLDLLAFVLRQPAAVVLDGLGWSEWQGAAERVLLGRGRRVGPAAAGAVGHVVVVVGGPAAAVVIVVVVEGRRRGGARRADGAAAFQGRQLVVLGGRRVQRGQRVLVPLLLVVVEQGSLVLLRCLAAATAAVLGGQGILVEVQLPRTLCDAARRHGNGDGTPPGAMVIRGDCGVMSLTHHFTSFSIHKHTVAAWHAPIHISSQSSGRNQRTRALKPKATHTHTLAH